MQMRREKSDNDNNATGITGSLFFQPNKDDIEKLQSINEYNGDVIDGDVIWIAEMYQLDNEVDIDLIKRSLLKQLDQLHEKFCNKFNFNVDPRRVLDRAVKNIIAIAEQIDDIENRLKILDDTVIKHPLFGYEHIKWYSYWPEFDAALASAVYFYTPNLFQRIILSPTETQQQLFDYKTSVQELNKKGSFLSIFNRGKKTSLDESTINDKLDTEEDSSDYYNNVC